VKKRRKRKKRRGKIREKVKATRYDAGHQRLPTEKREKTALSEREKERGPGSFGSRSAASHLS